MGGSRGTGEHKSSQLHTHQPLLLIAGGRNASTAATMRLSPRAAPSSSDAIHVFPSGITPLWGTSTLRAARMQTARAATADSAAVQEQACATERDLGVARLLPTAERGLAATSFVLAEAPLQLERNISREERPTSSSTTRREVAKVNFRRVGYPVEDGQQAVTYGSKTDNDRCFDGGNNRVEMCEGSGRRRRSCDSCVVSETLAKPQCEAGFLAESSCNGRGRCRDDVCMGDERYSGAAFSPSGYSSRKIGCVTDRVDRCYPCQAEERTRVFPVISGDTESMASGSVSPAVLVADAVALRLEKCYESRSLFCDHTHMETNGRPEGNEGMGRPLLQREKVHEIVQEKVQLGEQRESLHIQECDRKHDRTGQQPHKSSDASRELQLGGVLLPQQRLEKREGMDGSNEEPDGQGKRQLRTSASQPASSGISGRCLVIGCCGRAGHVEVFSRPQELQAAVNLSTVHVEGADGTSDVQLKKSYCSTSSSGANVFTHIPFVSQFPQPPASAVAARCFGKQPSDSLPPISCSIRVGSAPSSNSSLLHSQLTTAASQRDETAFLGGSVRPSPGALPQNSSADAVAHWGLTYSSVALLDTTPLPFSDDRSSLAEISASHHATAWPKTSRPAENIERTERGAIEDVRNCSSRSQGHSPVARNNSRVLHLARSFSESWAGSATPRSSLTELLDRLYQQQNPHGPTHSKHRLSHGQIYREEQGQLQDQQGVLMQQQPQARGLDAQRASALGEKDAALFAKQEIPTAYALPLRADRTAGKGGARRKWFRGAPMWVQAVAAGGDAGKKVAETAGSRQEVRPDSINSTFAASRSCESAAVSIRFREQEEEQCANEEAVGKRFAKLGSLLCVQLSRAAPKECTSHQKMHYELLESSQHGKLYQQHQREILPEHPQQEMQQQDLGRSCGHIEICVKRKNSRTECAQHVGHPSDGSGAFVADGNDLHRLVSDAVEGRRTVASVISCLYRDGSLDAQGGRRVVEDEILCSGAPIPARGSHTQSGTCTGKTWFSPCSATRIRGTRCGSAATSLSAAASGIRHGYSTDCNGGEPCSGHGNLSCAGFAGTGVDKQGLVRHPLRLLRRVGVVGASPSGVAVAGAPGETDPGKGDKRMPKGEQSTSAQPIGRSQSVLKRAASADPASGRFARVKIVSFANLDECESSTGGGTSTAPKGIEPALPGGVASASLPLCISSSNSDTPLPREIGRGTASDAVSGSERKGATKTTGPKRGIGGGTGERERAEVSLEMQSVDSGRAKGTEGSAVGYDASHEVGAGADQTSSRREGRAGATEKRKFFKKRFGTSLAAALGMFRGAGREAGTVPATERDTDRRQDAEGGDRMMSPRRGLRSGSSSLLSEDTLVRRGGDVRPAGRDRGEFHSVSRSSGGEESGPDSSGGDREASSRRRRRATNRRRDRRSNGSVGSRRGSKRNRGTSAYRARRGDRRAAGAPAPPLSDGLAEKASKRLTHIFRNVFRAIQNLTEHDTVFRMHDELSAHSSGLLPRGATPESEVTGGLSSVSSVPAPGASGAPGSRSSLRSGIEGTGLRQGVSATDSVTGSAPAGGITGREAATAESSLTRSGSSEVLLRRLPLKFVDGDLEDLFAGNINKWMTARLLLMGLLMLVVTSLMWPLMAWSFNLQDAFNHNEPIGVLFHVDMSLNVVVSLLFIVTRFSRTLTDHAEFIGDAGTFLVITIWGIWNTSASFILESSYVRDVINPQSTGGHEGYVSLEKTTSWSTAQEASSAVAYLYGLLLIVQLDVVYPSRTRRTWQVHLMFFLLSASSIIVRGAINPNFVPVPFVVIRVVTYLMLTVFLYVGRHATELQQRQTFYNWLVSTRYSNSLPAASLLGSKAFLCMIFTAVIIFICGNNAAVRLMTRKRVDRLESDLKRQKEGGKVSTAVEQLVDLIRQCKETFQSLEAGLPDASPFYRTQLDECNRTLDRCLSILTNTTNLYTVQFGDLDSDTHRDIIQAFFNSHNSSPADWARMTRGAFSAADAGPLTSALSQAARQPSGESKAFDHGITLDVLTFPCAPSDTPMQRPSSSSHGSSDVAYSSISSKGFADEAQPENGLLRRASTTGFGEAPAGSAGASPVPSFTPTAADASPGRTTADESKVSPREIPGDAVFDFTYASPRGRELSEKEPVYVQSTNKGARQREGQRALLPSAFKGETQKGDGVLSTTAMPEGQRGAKSSKRGKFAYLLPRTAVGARDVGLRRKRSSGLPSTSVVSTEAARRSADVATSKEYERPSDSTPGEVLEKRVGSRIPPQGSVTSAQRRSGATLTLTRELEGVADTGEVLSPTAAQPIGICVLDRADGRRLSSAVASDEVEEEEAVGGALGLERVQQKDVCPRGSITRLGADGRRFSSFTASVSTGRKDATVGALVYRSFVMDQRARREMRARNEAVARVLSLPTGSPQLNFVPRLSEEEVLTWDFDCLLYAKESPAPLLDVGYALLARPCENLSLSNKEVLLRFLMTVEAQYNAVPYHNSIHGCMVTQKMIALTHLMHLTNKVSNRDLAVMIVAGLCHDIGHPGRNNALLINAIDPVAVLYNDKSVLENYHSCLTFKTLDLPDCDIFWILRSKLRREYHVMRSLIIELILATDMKNHFETVSRFRIRRLASDFDISGEEDLWFLLKIVIKCADLAHCGVHWSQHFEWCLRLCTEFYDQGDEELARHLPVSPLCEREKHAEVAKAQLGFMNFVTIPLYEELVAVDTTGSVECYCISYMKANVRNWELTASAGVRVPLYGKDLTPDVQPPFSQLLDPHQHAKSKPGSKAAEIASRYAHVTLTCVDLTPLVMRTQLSRTQRDSQLVTDRSMEEARCQLKKGS